MIKVAQVVARELGADPARVGVTATRTDKIPNTSPTAASSGADINGMAARNAARTIKRRLRAHLGAKHGVSEEESFRRRPHPRRRRDAEFRAGRRLGAPRRVQLFADGFYKTPKIYYDRERVSGRPYYYFAAARPPPKC